MKKIAITLGDPAGIGPEVIARALLRMSRECLPLIIGDATVMREAVRTFRIPCTVKTVTTVSDMSLSHATFWCLDLATLKTFKKGSPDRENGIASAGYIRKAVELAMEKKVDAMVTAPISKEALHLAGLPWAGHTEMLAELTGTKEYAMMLVGGPLKVILVTTHAALRNVPDLITKERVLKTIILAHRASAMLGIRHPRIAVAGLNPHAGESGILGNEEGAEIVPAVREAAAKGMSVEGPYPPDIVFYRAYKGDFDMVVCMYHDQGLIPLKMIAFEQGVNVTVGLPIIRTSPDHGTAYDIAWKGMADPSSMIEAIRLALRLTL